ncbi:hypothetical protein [Rhodoferax sp. BLA1]|uniref:hypothetical protein n=1 Tax=Rhodoferax sp. BLA1 TaxID=2576062 RepID=UPI0015D36998|nr:hypothetical protein [Rhodoferax sp. BLA1]
MNTILLHLERLRRHYQAAVKDYDQVSLLDLSHTLRLWAELKKPLETLAPDFSRSIHFRTGLPAKKVLRAARGHRYVFSYMPGGVRTYASNGHLASGPEMDDGAGDFAAGIAVKVSPPLVEIGKFCVVGTSFDQPLIKALNEETVTRCGFTQWLGAEAVRLSFHRDAGPLEMVSISREMMIKRVANTLDGSHPSAAGGADVDNTFDAPVQHLLRYKMGGLPLPYFILLKIAQDILHVSPRIPGAPPAHDAV